MINLELYRVFYEVAKEGNITRASENLNISQPAVTKQIKNLESNLKVTLFIRTKKGVILTDAGKSIFNNIKQALNLINDSEDELKKINSLNKGTIKVGISTTLAKIFLFKYIKEFHEVYPNIKIEINTDPTSEAIKLLKIGVLDFIIAKFPTTKDNEIDYIELGELQDIFIANEKYKDLKNKILNIKELSTYDVLVQKEPSNSKKSFDKYCEENNANINYIMNIASSSLLIEFVKAGYGIGFVTKLYVEEELKSNELFELNIMPKIKPYKFGIMKLRNNKLSICSEKFIKSIKK